MDPVPARTPNDPFTGEYFPKVSLDDSVGSFIKSKRGDFYVVPSPRKSDGSTSARSATGGLGARSTTGARSAQQSPRENFVLVPECSLHQPLKPFPKLSMQSLIETARPKVDDSAATLRSAAKLGKWVLALDEARPLDKFLEQEFTVRDAHRPKRDKHKFHEGCPLMLINWDDQYQGMLTLPDAMERDKVRVLAVVQRYALPIKCGFRWYLSQCMHKTERKYYTVNATQFNQLLTDLRLPDRARRQGPTVFARVNTQSKDVFGSAIVEHTENPEREMMLTEWVEALIRVACVTFEDTPSVAEAFARFMAAFYAPHAKFFVDDHFRRRVLSQPLVRSLVCEYEPQLNTLFNAISTLEHDGADGEGRINVKEFVGIFARHVGWLGRHMSVPAALEVFLRANFELDNAKNWRDWDWDLEFAEFVEAVLRCVLQCARIETTQWSEDAVGLADAVRRGLDDMLRAVPPAWTVFHEKAKVRPAGAALAQRALGDAVGLADAPPRHDHWAYCGPSSPPSARLTTPRTPGSHRFESSAMRTLSTSLLSSPPSRAQPSEA